MGRNKVKTGHSGRSFSNIREASDFWDAHSVADIWDETKEVEADIKIDKEPKYIVLDKVLSKRIWKLSKETGMTPDTLVNSLLREKTASR